MADIWRVAVTIFRNSKEKPTLGCTLLSMKDALLNACMACLLMEATHKPTEWFLRGQVRMRQLQRDLDLDTSSTFGWGLSLPFASHTELSTGFWNLESRPTPEHRVLTGILELSKYNY